MMRVRVYSFFVMAGRRAGHPSGESPRANNLNAPAGAMDGRVKPGHDG
jgi:hypothetical protein